MDFLTTYKWPGNVRELVNTIERAVSFAEGELVEPRDLPETVRGEESAPRRHGASGPLSVGAADVDATFKDAKERWVSTFERDYILTLLKKNKGNISHAAREADIDRKYFRKLMKKYGIEGGVDVELEDDDADTIV
jgi:DNA-binding NtrC family response regulator